MDVPIIIGVILALAMSVVETINHAEHAYFDAAIMLLTFLLVGRYLDQSMRRRTRAVAGNLAALKAETATKFVGTDEISQVPVAAIRPGDIVLLRPGERCAVDGTVIEGRSEIDQSLITGETLYVDGGAGHRGLCRLAQYLRHAAGAGFGGVGRHAAGGDHTAARQRAAGALALRAARRPRVAALCAGGACHRLADHARLGADAGASWHDAIVTGVAVLIITCPCALGLAIPTVQTVASGAMFRAGVLLNSGDAIERLAEIDRVIFDKTGTLTLPDLDVVNAAGIPADVFDLAGRLALASHHPVAAAVARAAECEVAAGRHRRRARAGRARQLVEGEELRLGRPSFCDAERLANERREARSGSLRRRLQPRRRRNTCLPCARGCARTRRR